eukprot:TRINITY_DN66641_c0_g1_i1.p1 TRINITY_DN66641_c0_g1~~TRINITY_DN66641_c0_g1_i1.p1  ORF type:complete len:237 (-),score=44.80 TRINITY_DN66641_c0_g1_i1:26-736(-)
MPPLSGHPHRHLVSCASLGPASSPPEPDARPAATVPCTVVLRRPRISLQEVLLIANDGEEGLRDSVLEALRSADTEDLLGRLGSSEMVHALLDLLDTCGLEEMPVPRLRCRLFFRLYDSNAFSSNESEPLMRSLSGDKDLSLQLVVEDVFQRYLRNDPADFLLSGNDSSKSQRVAGSAILVLRDEAPKGQPMLLAPCGVASVQQALQAALHVDINKGVILAHNKDGLEKSFTVVQK